MSSVPSNNEDSNDDRRSINFSVSETHSSNVDEENGDYLDVSNEIPRIVPFMLSPLAISSPRTDSPPDTSDTPTININNDIPPAIQQFDNHNVDFRDIEYVT